MPGRRGAQSQAPRRLGLPSCGHPQRLPDATHRAAHSPALVGAYVLADELAAAEGEHHLAFARYEQVMRPYVTRG